MTIEERVNLVINMCDREVKRQEVLMHCAEKKGRDSDWIRHFDLQGMYAQIRDILNGTWDVNNF